MGLRHAVITSVDRDDLADLGSSRVRRRDRRDPPPGAGLPDRGADARLPGPGDAARARHRRAARRLQPQRRGRPAAVPGRAARLDVRALGARAAQRQGARRRRGHDEVGADGRARRDPRGAGRDVRRCCASTTCRCSRSASTCGPSEQHLPIVRYWHPDEFAALERAAYALGFEHVAAGPLVRSSYHADQHVPQPRPGVGPLAAADAPWTAALIPLRDSIRLARLPLVTIALIALNVIAYLLAIRGGGSIVGGPTARDARRATARSPTSSRTSRATASSRSAASRTRVLCSGQPGVIGDAAAAAGDLGDRLHVDVPARQPAAHRRQHGVPRGLRLHARGRDRAAALPRLLPARRASPRSR